MHIQKPANILTYIVRETFREQLHAVGITPTYPDGHLCLNVDNMHAFRWQYVLMHAKGTETNAN